MKVNFLLLFFVLVFLVLCCKNFEDANIKGWNGTNNVGEILAVGTYTFVVAGEFRNGKAFESKGNVTLLR